MSVINHLETIEDPRSNINKKHRAGVYFDHYLTKQSGVVPE